MVDSHESGASISHRRAMLVHGSVVISCALLLAATLSVTLSEHRPGTASGLLQTGTVWSVPPRLMEEAELARAEERVMGIKAELAAGAQSAPAQATEQPAGFVQAAPSAKIMASAHRPAQAAEQPAGFVQAAPRAKIMARAVSTHIVKPARAVPGAAVEIPGTKSFGSAEATFKEHTLKAPVAKAASAIKHEQAVQAEDRTIIAELREEQRKKMDRMEEKEINDWKAKQEAAFLSKRQHPSTLARIETSEKPKIRKWRAQQTSAWEQEKVSLAQEAAAKQTKINKQLEHEESMIAEWRNQQQKTIHRWKERESAKEGVRRVHMAQSLAHAQRVNAQERAAKHEIKVVKEKEMKEWKADRKEQARKRIRDRATAHSFKVFQDASRQVGDTLHHDSNKISSEPERERRKKEQIREVEWSESQAADSDNVARQAQRENSRVRQHEDADKLERKQVEILKSSY